MELSNPLISDYTWANKPSVAPLGQIICVTDVGENGILCRGNGTKWVRLNPIKVFSLSAPVSLTGSTSVVTLATVTIPAGLLGANGKLKIYPLWSTTNNANIKINTSQDVINSSQLLRTIKRYSEINLTELEKEKITQKINLSNVSESYNKGQHIKSIKNRINHREKSIAANKCPSCGCDLIKRKGKFGSFLGCTSYPKCRFIRNI